ncbi:MAG: hypothetical protein OXP37_02160 [Chloroflexota bacterium]|nr:hypothetical protein [Chloroflexota bacterium]
MEAFDHHRRDTALIQITTRHSRDVIDSNHLLIKSNWAFDFKALVAPLEEKYFRDSGRPATCPEIMDRVLGVFNLLAS